MLHNGFLVHPDIWMLWAAVFLAPLNTLGLIAILWRRK